MPRRGIVRSAARPMGLTGGLTDKEFAAAKTKILQS